MFLIQKLVNESEKKQTKNNLRDLTCLGEMVKISKCFICDLHFKWACKTQKESSSECIYLTNEWEDCIILNTGCSITVCSHE